jgi:penicillin G amidase
VIKSLLRFAILLLVVAITFTVMAIYWTFYKPLPDYESTLHIPEIRQEVTVKWDDYGVPHVFASNEHDLYTALGYIHAQDRLWQLTLNQLYLEGRFAEFLGKDLLPFDQYTRTIGFWRIAGELEVLSSPEDLQILQAYSNGVNRFIQENENRLPIEFALTGIKPLPWTPRHSLALGRALGWELNVSWWSKVTLGYLEDKLPAPTLRELFPDWYAPVDVNFKRSPKIESISDSLFQGNLQEVAMNFLNTDIQLRALMGQKGSHIGSNAWVADGSRTESGYPLLAGDPHLGLDMPGKWYEVHLNLNGQNISGATIAGAPYVVMGQTDRHAWSFTSLMPDDTDFFIEEVNPLDRSQYLAEKQDSTDIFKPFSTHREIIKTKEGEEVLHEVRITQNGPIISDIHPNNPLFEGKLISINWTGYTPSFELRALRNVAKATSFSEFQLALQEFKVPALNIMYADIDQNIAMITTGAIPIRQSVPLLFKEGWNPVDRWSSMIPSEQMPRVINPQSGYIANANNPVGGTDYPHYITAFWEPDSRIRRIEEVLGSRRLHNKSLYRELQNDVFSHQAQDITSIILPVLEVSNDTLVKKVLPYLKNWDFKYTHSATAASLFEGFFLNFVENTFKSTLGDAVFESFIQLENFPTRVTTQLLKQPSIWLKTTTGDTVYRDSLIIQSMRQTVIELNEKYGSNTTEWRWENQHTLTLGPALLSQAASDPNSPGALKLIVANILSSGPHPVPGHSMTVNNTQYEWHAPYAQVLGASIRRIVDLSDLSSSESILPTGQSGNPLSDHFGDQTELWLSGKYRIFEHNDQVAGQENLRTMRLIPSAEIPQ